MKRNSILFIILILLLLLPASYGFCDTGNKPEVLIFYSSHCKKCLKLKTEYLVHVKKRYEGKVSWKELDIDENPDNLKQALTLAIQSKKTGPLTPSVAVDNTFLSGKREIVDKLEWLIDVSLMQKASHRLPITIDVTGFFDKISIFTVITSGLIDGVNPCAFAVIIFLISFLALHKYSKQEVLCIGSFYCLAVFITYLLIGLGLFTFLYSFAGFHVLAKALNHLIAVLCFAFSGLSLYDYFTFKKTNDMSQWTLKLPQSLANKIERIITSKLGDKGRIRTLALVAIAVGFLVSLLEMFCTGQIYLPTIVFILKYTGFKLRALVYFLLYNFMFIAPLLLVFLLFLFGIHSKVFNRFLRKNLGKAKILIVIVFALLGILILWLS